MLRALQRAAQPHLVEVLGMERKQEFLVPVCSQSVGAVPGGRYAGLQLLGAVLEGVLAAVLAAVLGGVLGGLLGGVLGGVLAACLDLAFSA